MADKINTQTQNSNSGNQQSGKGASSGSHIYVGESAVHKPVPGKGGDSGKGGTKR